MISVRALHKSFGPLKAVNGVSFEVMPHETFGLLGPNGAGKSTTIHMMVGLLRPDSGEIHINGESDPTRPAVRRSIGIAPQALTIYEDMTAEENLRFIGRIYGLHGRRLRRRVAACLEQAGLADRRRDLVRTFSGGMKQRLHVVCALIHEPQVIFLDEPTVGVDPQARNHIFELIESLKRQGCTILLTTHHMEEAERLCDRIAIMDHGQILAMDDLDRLLDAHGGRMFVEAELESAPDDPSGLPGELVGTSLRLETDQPFETVKALAAASVPIRSVTIERPNLETVFLQLTGRRLRD